jgi:hypothetical protein
MSITQQALIAAEPAEVYAVLADADALSALSGMSGVPGRSAGEEFSAFDGNVTGRQIELVPGSGSSRPGASRSSRPVRTRWSASP